MKWIKERHKASEWTIDSTSRRFRTIALVAGMLVVAACGATPPAGAGTVTLPDLSGATVQFAERTLKDLGLTPEVVDVGDTGQVPGTVVTQNPAADAAVPAGSLVVLRVASSPQAQLENPTTTTTTEPEPHVPDVAVKYFEELARGNVAAAERAAEQSVSLAEGYARYVAAIGGLGPSDIDTRPDGSVRLCAADRGASSCYTYSYFELMSGKLSAFSVDSVPLKSVFWRKSELSNQALCWFYDGDECNFDKPEFDTNLYMFPQYAYRSASGNLIVVIDVVTGQRNFDVLWNNAAQALRASATTKAGNAVSPDAWWTYPDIAVSSNLGLRIPKDSRTNLILSFPGFAGSMGDVPVVIELDWGGRSEFELDLRRRPGS